MSALTVASLPRISREALAAVLQGGSTPAKLAIIDVRDSGMYTTLETPSQKTRSSKHALQITSVVTFVTLLGYLAAPWMFVCQNLCVLSRIQNKLFSTVL